MSDPTAAAPPDMDDPPSWRSKKFLAWLISGLTWKLLVVAVLFWGFRMRESHDANLYVFGLILAIVGIAGAGDIYYLAGQMGLDKFIRLAQIGADTERALVTRDFTLHAPGEKPGAVRPEETKKE